MNFNGWYIWAVSIDRVRCISARFDAQRVCSAVAFIMCSSNFFRDHQTDHVGSARRLLECRCIETNENAPPFGHIFFPYRWRRRLRTRSQTFAHRRVSSDLPPSRTSFHRERGKDALSRLFYLITLERRAEKPSCRANYRLSLGSALFDSIGIGVASLFFFVITHLHFALRLVQFLGGDVLVTGAPNDGVVPVTVALLPLISYICRVHAPASSALASPPFQNPSQQAFAHLRFFLNSLTAQDEYLTVSTVDWFAHLTATS